MASLKAIAAIATPSGRGGIGVVRISGPMLGAWLPALVGKSLTPRYATLCSFLDAQGVTIDQGIAIFYPTPQSFTGEDVIELQGHGGDAVLRLVLARCLELGARLAAPGEFTQRAFLNNKLDLAQAEAVADLIDAASVEGARSAMRSLVGEFSSAVNGLVAALIELRMWVEATLDFPEEEIDFISATTARDKLADLKRRLQDLSAVAEQGSLLREGLRVVLVGQANVGKSSLLNQLAGEDLAIVATQPGTTRDSLRHGIAINGVPLHIIDTAGLRDTEDEIEALGIERTWREIERAGAVLVIVDASSPEPGATAGLLAKLPSPARYLKIMNKIDLINTPPRIETVQEGHTIYLSAKTGAGIDLLRQELLRLAGWQTAGEGVFMARARHLSALAVARVAVAQAEGLWPQRELLAEELRKAQVALNSITGEFSADDLLGEIFSRFCIGK